MTDAQSARRARLVVVGGFLGAGKTTALLRLAQSLHEEGRRVGLITNDQAADLVDTGTLRVHGFRVAEVAGACFCCKFDDLAQAAESLCVEERPDVLLGEPVGSCTDLAATVVAPFRKLYGDRYDVAPYSVLVDPARARAIVLEKGFGGFSPQVAYIFQKQLEEADLIGVNKADLLNAAERELLVQGLAREFPRAEVLVLSGLTGEGFDAWRARLESGGAAGRNVADVDYDVYAAGEAELGWLNLAEEVTAAGSLDTDAAARALVEDVAGRLAAAGIEVAHLKVLFEEGGRASGANHVGAGGSPLLSTSRGGDVPAGRRVQLTLNLRAHAAPEVLLETAEAALARLHDATGARARRTAAAHFRPGRPVPTHRLQQTEVDELG